MEAYLFRLVLQQRQFSSVRFHTYVASLLAFLIGSPLVFASVQAPATPQLICPVGPTSGTTSFLPFRVSKKFMVTVPSMPNASNGQYAVDLSGIPEGEDVYLTSVFVRTTNFDKVVQARGALYAGDAQQARNDDDLVVDGHRAVNGVEFPVWGSPLYRDDAFVHVSGIGGVTTELTVILNGFVAVQNP